MEIATRLEVESLSLFIPLSLSLSLSLPYNPVLQYINSHTVHCVMFFSFAPHMTFKDQGSVAIIVSARWFLSGHSGKCALYHIHLLRRLQNKQLMCNYHIVMLCSEITVLSHCEKVSVHPTERNPKWSPGGKPARGPVLAEHVPRVAWGEGVNPNTHAMLFFLVVKLLCDRWNAAAGTSPPASEEKCCLHPPRANSGSLAATRTAAWGELDVLMWEKKKGKMCRKIQA